MSRGDDFQLEEFLRQNNPFNGVDDEQVHLQHVNAVFDDRFQQILDHFIPELNHREMFVKWKEKIEVFFENDDVDFNESEEFDFLTLFATFHNKVLLGLQSEIENEKNVAKWKDIAEQLGIDSVSSDSDTRTNGGFPVDSEAYARNCLKSIRLFKSAQKSVRAALSPMRQVNDDSKEENEHITVDSNHSTRRDELYDFASAGKTLPEARLIPWWPGEANSEEEIVLPGGFVERLIRPKLMGENDDEEAWELRVSSKQRGEEMTGNQEEIDKLKQGIKTLLADESCHQKVDVITDLTARPSPRLVESASERIKSGQLNVNVDGLFMALPSGSHYKFVGVRDDTDGRLTTLQEVKKPIEEIISDQHIRTNPEAWENAEAGIQISASCWEPLGKMSEADELTLEQGELSKKNENREALRRGCHISDWRRRLITERIESVRDMMDKKYEKERQGMDEKSTYHNILSKFGINCGMIPREFSKVEDFLKDLDMNWFREKDKNKSYSIENDSVIVPETWATLDQFFTCDPSSSGKFDEEEEEFKTLKKTKDPPPINWDSIVEGAKTSFGDSERAFEEFEKMMLEVREEEKKKQDKSEAKSTFDSESSSYVKRILDESFIREWVQLHGDKDGLKNWDPSDFMPSLDLISLNEYEDKYLTFPFTSPYEFLPNFVRFRRVAKNSELYSEFAFQKLDKELNKEDNFENLKSVLKKLNESGPLVDVEKLPMFVDMFTLGTETAGKFDPLLRKFIERNDDFMKSLLNSDEIKIPDVESFLNESKRSEYTKAPQPHSLPKSVASWCYEIEPFKQEAIDRLPKVEDIQDVEVTNKTEEVEEVTENEGPGQTTSYNWKPFDEFDNYEGYNVLDLLKIADELTDSRSMDPIASPPEDLLEWIQTDTVVTSERIRQWQKYYETSGSIDTALDVVPESVTVGLRQEGKTSDEEPAVGTSEKILEEEDGAGDLDAPKEDLSKYSIENNAELIMRLAEKFGINSKPSVEQWAEEVNMNDPVDMSTISNPAMEFRFELDNFQKQAILALENHFNVFVAAHTSAGKTVVAEYAIAMSKRNKSRAIYTSPVKALSNQKFYDFKGTFDSVGLMTGDVQLNENADCLIMTTEILRSMLYHSSEKIRDLEFVIFDEVHYINDPERGHVWEEVLILLPDNVQIVMLSATAPNTMEFAAWVGLSKQRKVMVCSTKFRPVPLKHYLFIPLDASIDPAKGQFLLKEGDSPLNALEYARASELIKAQDQKEAAKRMRLAQQRRADERANEEGGGGRGGGGGGGGGRGGRGKQGAAGAIKNYNMKEGPHNSNRNSMWQPFTKYLLRCDWLPAVVFAFSRKKCDELACRLKTLVDLTTKHEKWSIRMFFEKQVKKLDELDQDLPQIELMKEQLLNGIGVHHSGILPILKEIVERLFHDGKVKILFATETFAIGVNMPARTVVFNSIDKFDGVARRLLLPAEYIQMAGRAGRRGQDTYGNVVILNTSRRLMPMTELQTVMLGTPSKLISQFRISYRMILNSLTTRGMLPVHAILAKSFLENEDQTKNIMLQKELIELQEYESKLRANLQRETEFNVKTLTEFYDCMDQFLQSWNSVREDHLNVARMVKDLVPGRFVRFTKGREINKTGLLLFFDIVPTTKRKQYSLLTLKSLDKLYQKLLPKQDLTDAEKERWFKMISFLPLFRDQHVSAPEDIIVVKVFGQDIMSICKESIALDQRQVASLLRDVQLLNLSFKDNIRCKLNENLNSIGYKLFNGGFMKTLDDQDLHGLPVELHSRVSEALTLRQTAWIVAESLTVSVDLEAFARVFHWKEIDSKKKELEYKLSPEAMSLSPQYERRLEVLKVLQYISEKNTVQMKGYMASRISKYELIVCEMLADNILEDLSPEEVAALMSFLVYQGKSIPRPVDNEIPADSPLYQIPPSLENAIRRTQKIIDDIEALENSKLIGQIEEQRRLSFDLVDVIYNWARQKPFKDLLMENDDIFQEGMLVRWIQQLLEVLKEIESAAKVMGDPTVPAKIHEAGKAIKRGIVFAPSLYTTMD